MKTLVIGVVLVFLSGYASHMSPSGKAIGPPVEEHFSRDPIEYRASGESENDVEVGDSPLCFRLMP